MPSIFGHRAEPHMARLTGSRHDAVFWRLEGDSCCCSEHAMSAPEPQSMESQHESASIRTVAASCWIALRHNHFRTYCPQKPRAGSYSACPGWPSPSAKSLMRTLFGTSPSGSRRRTFHGPAFGSLYVSLGPTATGIGIGTYMIHHDPSKPDKRLEASSEPFCSETAVRQLARGPRQVPRSPPDPRALLASSAIAPPKSHSFASLGTVATQHIGAFMYRKLAFLVAATPANSTRHCFPHSTLRQLSHLMFDQTLVGSPNGPCSGRSLLEAGREGPCKGTTAKQVTYEA